jgi:hypothetical protein
VSGVRGVFRSDDGGASWVRINDDGHQYGNAGSAISGDPRVYGRVYLGTNGRGNLDADRVGGGSASPSVSGSATRSPSSSPSASRNPSPSPMSSPSPSPSGPPGGCSVTYSVTGQWGGGFQGDVKVTNTGSVPVNGWTLQWSFADGQVISQLWNGTVV